MSEDLLTSIERFEQLLRKNRRYHAESFNFVYEALDWTLHNVVAGPAEPSRHVSCRELLDGICRFALEKFGLLASTVFESWGVRSTDDWGEIVFTLIEYDLMGKQESDQKEDFSRVYEFSSVFNVDLDFEYDERTSSWRSRYRHRARSPIATGGDRR